MNLVVGATGMLGTEICRQLAAEGKPVRGLARPTADAAKVTALKSLGVHIVPGDLQDRASLEAACRGVETVITTVATTLSRQPHDSIRATDLEGQKSLVDAARAAGVRRFVYISVAGNIPTLGAFMEARRSVEAHLRASGMTYTILRPAPFMEVWLGPFVGFDMANATVQVFGAGDGKLSWIALDDVARFAVKSLDTPAARDATIDLGGPDWLSHNEVIRLCEQMGGRPFAVEHVPVEALQARLTDAADEYARTFAGLMLFMAQGESQPIDMRETLRAFPLQLGAVRDYARRMLVAPAAATP